MIFAAFSLPASYFRLFRSRFFAAVSTLHTAIAGLTLSPLQERDAVDLFRLTVANREHLRRWLPWVDGIRVEDDTARFARDALEGARLGFRADFVLKADGRIVGTLALHTINRGNRTGMVGYWLEAASRGRGWMTAAVGRLLQHGYEELDLHRIEIRAAVGNGPSRGVCDRLGFRFEGVAREAECLPDGFVDLCVYALLRPEWRAGKSPSADRK